MDPLIKSQLLYQLSYTPTPPEPTLGAHIASVLPSVQPQSPFLPRRLSAGFAADQIVNPPSAPFTAWPPMRAAVILPLATSISSLSREARPISIPCSIQ